MKTINTSIPLFLCIIILLILGLLPNASGSENVRFFQMLKAGLENPVDVAVSKGGMIYVVDENQSKVFIFDQKGKLKSVFGEKGSDAGQFNRPKSVALSPHGRVIVADTGNNRIQVFDSIGNLLFQFGDSGSASGQLKVPAGLAVDQFGFIFVADQDNRRVQIFSPNGIFLKSFPTEFRPTDIALDLKRNIYVLLPEKGNVVSYSPSGVEGATFSCVLEGRNYISQANGISVDHRGDIYLTEGIKHSIKKINRYEDVLISFGSQGEGRGQFNDASGVFADQGEKIYVADSKNKRVQILRITGSKKDSIVPVTKSPLILDFESRISVKEGIVDLISLSGRGLYALSDSTHEILFKNNKNKVIGVEGNALGEFRKPKAIHVSLDGRIFVADTGNNRVQIFSADGSNEYAFGKRGNRDGQFSGPQGISVDSTGKIYVADTQNNRIQIFNHDGIFLNAFGHSMESNKEVSADLRRPTAIAISMQDEIYVLDQGNTRVQVFAPDGMLIRTIGEKGNLPGQFENPVDIALDENDNLYVVDQGNHRIQIFNPRGNFIQAFGSPGKGGGYFQKVSAVAVSEGKIFVADYQTDNIEVFRYIPDGLKTNERIYATKTAYPPEEFDGNETARFYLAKEDAKEKAIQDLIENAQYSREQLVPFIRIVSVEILNDGKVKVTVCAPSDIPEEIVEDEMAEVEIETIEEKKPIEKKEEKKKTFIEEMPHWW